MRTWKKPQQLHLLFLLLLLVMLLLVGPDADGAGNGAVPAAAGAAFQLTSEEACGPSQ
jgi:hypothetical protein